MPLPEGVIRPVVIRALEEDIGPGDVTTAATVAAEAQCRAEVVAKAEGVVCGLGVMAAVFAAVDGRVAFAAECDDGRRVVPSDVVARLAGPTRAVLTGERTALNLLQRLSGIATLTAQYAAAAAGTRAQILDTRKTAPGLRALDKYAVRVGGGRNHRFGLFDGVLIKDNHIRAAGGVGEAVARARRAVHHLLKIEVEAQSREQVAEALEAGADVVMFDNMSPEEVRAAVAAIGGRALTEVSGGVTLATARAYAETGADFISVGALTHSAPALDFSLEIVHGE